MPDPESLLKFVLCKSAFRAQEQQLRPRKRKHKSKTRARTKSKTTAKMQDNDDKGVPTAKRQKTKHTTTGSSRNRPPATTTLPCAENGSHTSHGNRPTNRGRTSQSSNNSSGDESLSSTSTAVNNLGISLYRSFPHSLSQGSNIVINRKHLNYFKVLLRTSGSLGLARFGLGLPGDLVGRLNEDNLGFVYARTSTENTRHTLQMKLHNQPCLSYIEPASKRFLDLGAGSGIWASDVATKCGRLGTEVDAGDRYEDMLTMEPSPLPPNFHFVNMDIIHGPLVGSRAKTGDLVDMIRLSHAIAHVTDRKFLLDTCYSALKNGGHIEIQAFEPIVRKRDEPEDFDHPLNTFFRLLCRDIVPDLSAVHPVDDLVAGLDAAGFTEVEVMTQLVPIGVQHDVGWMKRRVAGALFRHVLHDYVSHIDRSMFALRGLNAEQIDTLIQVTRDAVDVKDNRYYMRLVFVSGKKPSSGWDDTGTDMGSDSDGDESMGLMIGGTPSTESMEVESPA